MRDITLKALPGTALFDSIKYVSLQGKVVALVVIASPFPHICKRRAKAIKESLFSCPAPFLECGLRE
jgi:hypothetical protein